ncbi:MAG TPA: hypothetical protein VF756_03710 [Thermoanaerobaculia bacterium]
MKRSRLVYLAVVGALLLISFRAHAAPPNTAGSLNCKSLPFVYNDFPTSIHGPARADIIVAGEKNMLPCSGGAYALCYYSGPSPMPCKIDREKNVALCECYGYESSTQDYKYFVDINAILNTCVYIETARKCLPDGSNCTSENSAPVCAYINRNALMPNADLVSTFSTAKVAQYGQGCTQCHGLYAGCMTAPCTKKTNEQGQPIVVCECPLANGSFQVGQNGATCNLGNDLVWSAAYNTGGCPGASGN